MGCPRASRRWHPILAEEQALPISFALVVIGVPDRPPLSAMKRGPGAEDQDIMIEGHRGMPDRRDFRELRRPVFFHIVRFFI